MCRVKVMETETFGERVYIGVERGFNAVGYVVPDGFEDIGVGVCGGSGVEDVGADS